MESRDYPVPTVDEAEAVQVGVVVGTHGYDGRIRVASETDNPLRFRRGESLWIAGKRYTIEHAGGTKSVRLLKLEGIDSKEDARHLVREPVFVPASALPALPEGTYYHFHLIDMTVVDADTGEELGKLTEILPTGANDVYVVTQPGRELLIPAIADVVREVDVASSRMTVSLPTGLEWRAIGPTEPEARRPRRRRGPSRKPPPSTSA